MADLVFGGTSGISLGIAQAFASAGAKVGVASRNKAKVDAAVAQLSQHGTSARGFSADVRHPEGVRAAVEAFASEFGTIDVLVSGAAGNFLARADQLSP